MYRNNTMLCPVNIIIGDIIEQLPFHSKAVVCDHDVTWSCIGICLRKSIIIIIVDLLVIL